MQREPAVAVRWTVCREMAEVVAAWAAVWVVVVVACSIRSHTSVWDLSRQVARFDTTNYVDIATLGYPSRFIERSTIGYLPGYPMAIAAVHRLTGASAEVAGSIISLVAGLVGAVLFDRLLRRRGTSDEARRWALAIWLLYPWAFFQYGAIYTEPLFSALALAAFLALEHRRTWLATLLAVPAAATRPTGIVLVLGLTVASVWLATADGPEPPPVPVGDRLRRAPLKSFAPLLGLAGSAALALYSAARWGRPLAYFQVQASLTNGFSVESLSKVHFASTLLKAPSSPAIALNLVASAVVVAGVILAVRIWLRRGEPGYAVFLAVLVALQWANSDNFTSAGRYVSAAFPAAILLGEWSATHRRGAALLVGTAGVGMVWLATTFAIGSGYPGW